MIQSIKDFSKNWVPFIDSENSDTLSIRTHNLAMASIAATSAITLALVGTICANPAFITSLSTSGLIAVGVLPFIPIALCATITILDQYFAKKG